MIEGVSGRSEGFAVNTLLCDCISEEWNLTVEVTLIKLNVCL